MKTKHSKNLIIRENHHICKCSGNNCNGANKIEQWSGMFKFIHHSQKVNDIGRYYREKEIDQRIGQINRYGKNISFYIGEGHMF